MERRAKPDFNCSDAGYCAIESKTRPTMKIQCACGAKYAFDVMPGMAQGPVSFVCPACGLDSSEFVTSMVKKEFSESSPAVAAPSPSAQPARAVARVTSGSETKPRLRIHKTEAPAAPVVEATDRAAAVAEAPQMCGKHPGHLTVAHCAVCSKPICP